MAARRIGHSVKERREAGLGDIKATLEKTLIQLLDIEQFD